MINDLEKAEMFNLQSVLFSSSSYCNSFERKKKKFRIIQDPSKGEEVREESLEQQSSVGDGFQRSSFDHLEKRATIDIAVDEEILRKSCPPKKNRWT